MALLTTHAPDPGQTWEGQACGFSGGVVDSNKCANRATHTHARVHMQGVSDIDKARFCAACGGRSTYKLQLVFSLVIFCNITDNIQVLSLLSIVIKYYFIIAVNLIKVTVTVQVFLIILVITTTGLTMILVTLIVTVVVI